MAELLASEDLDGEVTASDLDASRFRFESKSIIVESLVERLRKGTLDLMPAVRPDHELARERHGSRFIESLLLRIPLPSFHLDATDDDRWLPIDGLQRLRVLHRFVVEQSFALGDLEFLSAHKGLRFDALPRAMQRRIAETPLSVHLVQPGTPPEVRANLWRRLQRGGEPLSGQEVRHALHGAATPFLQAQMTQGFHALFVGAQDTGRMGLEECVLGFFAVCDTPVESPGERLDDTMARLAAASDAERAETAARCARAIAAAHALLGDGALVTPDGRLRRAFFAYWTAALDGVDDAQLATLTARREQLTATRVLLSRVAVVERIQEVLA